MRAFGSFLLFVLGLATGGGTGMWLAQQGGPSSQAVEQMQAELASLNDQLAETANKLSSSELIIEGSLDVLGQYKQQVATLQARLEQAEAVAINAQQQAAEANALTGGQSTGQTANQTGGAQVLVEPLQSGGNIDQQN